MTISKPKRYLWIAGAVGFLLFYFIFDPVAYGWMPQCLFHRFTGLQCMGCGSQRVVHALLHGQIREAWEANTLLVVSLPFLAFLLWLEFSRTNHPILYRRVHSQPVIIAVALILLLWLLLRNLLSL